MSGDSAEAVAKLVVSAGALMLCAGFAWYNTSNSNDKIKAIESGPSVIFNSVADCIARENTQSNCNASHGIANSESRSLGTRIKYSFKFSCEKVHGNTCEYHYRKNSSYYTPIMMAWQASQADIKIAVPLYATHEVGKYMRTDGKIISAEALATTSPSAAPSGPTGTF